MLKLLLLGGKKGRGHFYPPPIHIPTFLLPSFLSPLLLCFPRLPYKFPYLRNPFPPPLLYPCLVKEEGEGRWEGEGEGGTPPPPSKRVFSTSASPSIQIVPARPPHLHLVSALAGARYCAIPLLISKNQLQFNLVHLIVICFLLHTPFFPPFLPFFRAFCMGVAILQLSLRYI